MSSVRSREAAIKGTRKGSFASPVASAIAHPADLRARGFAPRTADVTKALIPQGPESTPKEGSSTGPGADFRDDRRNSLGRSARYTLSVLSAPFCEVTPSRAG